MFAAAAGAVAERRGEHATRIAAVCFLANAAVAQAYALCPGVVELLAVRLVQGALNGLAWVLIQYVLGTAVAEEFRGRAYSLYFASGVAGVAAGNALYAHLASLPLKASLDASSLLFLVAAVLSLLVKARPAASRAPRPRRLYRSAVASAYPLMALVMGVAVFGSVVRGDLVYIYLGEFVGLGRNGAALVVAVANVLSLLGGYALSWMSDKLGDAPALRLSTLIGLVGALLLGISHPYPAAAGLLAFYTASSAVFPVSRRAAMGSPGMGGVVLGLVNFAGNVGTILGSAAAGALYDVVGSACLAALRISLFVVMMAPAMLLALAMSFLIEDGSRANIS